MYLTLTHTTDPDPFVCVAEVGGVTCARELCGRWGVGRGSFTLGPDGTCRVAVGRGSFTVSFSDIGTLRSLQKSFQEQINLLARANPLINNSENKSNP